MSLALRLADSRDEVKREVLANHKAVLMSFPFWQSLIPATVGVTATHQEELLACIDSVWPSSAIGFPLSQLTPGEVDAAGETRSHGREECSDHGQLSITAVLSPSGRTEKLLGAAFVGCCDLRAGDDIEKRHESAGLRRRATWLA